MPVPKKRTSHSRSKMRQSHDGLTASSPILCANCGEPTVAHRVCAKCGYYRGRLMVRKLAPKVS